VGCAADSRGAPEAGRRDLTGGGLQLHGLPSDAALTDLADGAVDGPADRGGLPLGDRPAISPARPRCGLQGRVLQPRTSSGDPRSEGRPSVPVAESVRGAPHWDPAPQVPRPHGGAQRDPPASPAARKTTLSTTTVSGPTSHWRRTPRSQDRWSTPTRAESSRSPWSEACIISAHGWLRKRGSACWAEPHHGVGGRGARLAVLAPPPLWV
jgi:hypothetical protein